MIEVHGISLRASSLPMLNLLNPNLALDELIDVTVRAGVVRWSEAGEEDDKATYVTTTVP